MATDAISAREIGYEDTAQWHIYLWKEKDTGAIKNVKFPAIAEDLADFFWRFIKKRFDNLRILIICCTFAASKE